MSEGQEKAANEIVGGRVCKREGVRDRLIRRVCRRDRLM